MLLQCPKFSAPFYCICVHAALLLLLLLGFAGHAVARQAVPNQGCFVPAVPHVLTHGCSRDGVQGIALLLCTKQGRAGPLL